jgi:riboflavin biosynthesis pyrimidine reductase
VTVALLGAAAGPDPLDPVALEAAYAAPASWVRANFVVALDGAVEVGGVSGPLGGPADREIFATLRALADVVLVGAGTARAEDYGPAWLAPPRRDRRLARGQTALPVVAVATASADLDVTSRLFTQRREDQPAPPRPIVLTVESAPPDRLRALGEVAEVVVCGGDRVDPAAALAALGSRGLSGVLCEGGPGLLADLVAAGLLDELCLTHAPVLGGPGRRTLSGPGSAPGGPPTGFALTGLLTDAGVLFTRWARRDGPT